MRRGDDSFVAVCARAARKRAAAAQRNLGPVRKGRDPEALHDLRVDARRLREALSILHKGGVRKVRRWRRRVRRLTRALGPPRDLDVQLDFLGAFRKRASRSRALDRLFDRLRKRRRKAQRGVRKALRRVRQDGTLEAVVRWAGPRAKGARGPHTPAARALAARRIRRRLDAMLALAPAVSREEAADAHHRLRIAARRLRYTLEILRPVFGRRVVRLIAAIRALQRILGRLHDCDVLIASIPARDAGLAPLRRDRGRRRLLLYRRLVAWWRSHDGVWESIRRMTELPDEAPATLALIGDIHANRQALEAVLADIDRRGIREILQLGDIVGYGAAPGEVLGVLRRRGIPGIAGNLDRKLFRVAGPDSKRETDPVSLKRLTHCWTWEQLAPADRAWLRALPDSLRLRRGGQEVLLVHGSPDSDEEYIESGTPRKRLRALARMARADVVAAGHAHVPYVGRAGGTCFVNVGSVGRPEDRPRRACYAVLNLAPDRVRVRHVRVPYDIAGAVADVRRAGLPGPYARMILTGKQLVGVLKR
jgi:CHAD domain-containing protein/predicted phosphodiesterase